MKKKKAKKKVNKKVAKKKTKKTREPLNPDFTSMHKHLGHKLTVVGDDNQVHVKCLDCNEIISSEGYSIYGFGLAYEEGVSDHFYDLLDEEE